MYSANRSGAKFAKFTSFLGRAMARCGGEGGFAAGDGLSSECGLGVGKIVSRTRRRHVLRDGLRPTRVNNIV